MRRSVVAGCSTSVGSLFAENSRKLGCHCEKYLGSPSLSRRDVRSHVATSKCHVATSVFEASVTSRREIPRRDVILKYLCHIAT